MPDIVTMGKPIGNGHPLAAVVTTREVARSFETGMEYFNTFGGNPVSCAIGLAVLDVIESENLRGARARGRSAFPPRAPVVGGRTPPDRRCPRARPLPRRLNWYATARHSRPAREEAAEIVERMKDRGVLLSTDGPFENIIKIKPPMVFTTRNADAVVSTMGEVLAGLSRSAAADRERDPGSAADSNRSTS